ncbi:M14 family metallopeptidase [Pontimicrobium sp. SW4]|uniref:M14 family metallopeptidase n=1 Tax=Pontimicrobium sp. SW4 TaxID=3153519 RepID=A0AAU7BSY3_9FLAO
MKSFLRLAAFLVCLQLTAQSTPWSADLITTPEKSNYQKTSTYAEVMDFIKAIKSKSSLVHLEFMGKSMEGKDIPVVVMANPKISSPQEAKDSGKPVMYVQGNIHSGEVEGKEVLQQLMRDILLGDKKHLLDNQIIIFAPIYNTDSNDKMEKGRRPSQEDSPVEVGIRANSQGFDLNRDGVKMEAFETEGLVQNVILKWDPEMLVDLHTTNGTWHGYGITYAPSYHYAGEKAPYDFTWNTMLPSIVKSIDKNYGVKLGPYGGYSLRQGWPAKAIYTYNHHPRYIVNQMGLRNKVGILSEAFAHDRFYKRMNGTYGFVAEILEFTHNNGKKMAEINAKATQDAIDNVKQNAGSAKKGVRFKMVPLEDTFTLRTYDYITYNNEAGEERYIRSGKIIDIPNVQNYSKFEAEVESTLPRGYFLPKSMKHIVDHLRKQGIEVTELKASKKAVGEEFIMSDLNLSKRKFEGHFMANAKGEFVAKTKRFKKGDYWIDMAQPLSNLIFYMLEPQSDDGLVTWNFFDDYFKEKGIENKPVAYPVFKYYKLR